ncbi:hypothetical protein BRO54_0332 [Geobacillus proteiniphilus]|uniref:Uncharacterized protein n=1 Tax=Geobacillus proteiniphilus TaxID=860353 RepID=A0A1Q5T969_9BACL|nr:hypothetical protein BRO54_0332 [Geobacillus proteiniphilus]
MAIGQHSLIMEQAKANPAGQKQKNAPVSLQTGPAKALQSIRSQNTNAPSL